MVWQVDRTAMRFVRVILAMVIALSVAMLPAVGSAASMIGSTPQGAPEVVSARAVTPSEMSAAVDECCPDQAKKAAPCDQSNHQCPMAFCAAQPVSMAATAVFHFDFPILAANALPIPVDQVVSLHSGSPPFRPPRV
jgi:hypothetical protein